MSKLPPGFDILVLDAANPDLGETPLVLPVIVLIAAKSAAMNIAYVDTDQAAREHVGLVERNTAHPPHDLPSEWAVSEFGDLIDRREMTGIDQCSKVGKLKRFGRLLESATIQEVSASAATGCLTDQERVGKTVLSQFA